MAISRVKNVKDSGTSMSANLNFTSTTTGNLLVVCIVSQYAPTTPSGYVLQGASLGNPNIHVFHRVNAPNTGLLTISFGVNSGPYIAFGMEYSGVSSSENQSVANDNDYINTYFTVGPITTGSDGVIVSVTGGAFNTGFDNGTGGFSVIDSVAMAGLSGIVLDKVAVSGTYDYNIIPNGTPNPAGHYYSETIDFFGSISNMANFTGRRIIRPRRGKRGKL